MEAPAPPFFLLGRAPAAARACPANQTVAQRIWFHVARRMGPLFFAAGNVQSNDYLVEVVSRDAPTASWVIQCVSLLSAINSILVGCACSLFLMLYWSCCAECDRPLRWWLLVQATLQFSQLPTRLVLFLCIRHVEITGGDIEATVKSFTASPAWRSSKTVALGQYAWFVLGIVWWMHTQNCPLCPGIGKMTAAVMLVTAARAAASMVFFRFIFPMGGRQGGEAAAAVVGATPAQIAAIGTLRFSAENAGDGQTNCSICLNDYESGTMIRRLPCGHDFHRRCVDKWLHKNKRCPLCLHAVDELCKRALCHKKAE